MKIGIITLPPLCNYGGIIQSYALQKTLQKAGHQVVLIDFPNEWNIKNPQKTLLYINRFIQKYILRKPITVKIDKKYNDDLQLITQNTSKFINKYIQRIIISDFSELQPSKFDALVVGSDQIWRPKYFNRAIENAYFSFAKDWKIKRISYAASFGTDKWEYTPEQTAACSQLIRLFDGVSVRENSGIKLCNKYLESDAIQVLDPTMLLEKEDYIGLIKAANLPQSTGDLFCYILDKTPEKDEITSQLSKRYKLTPFEVNAKYNDSNAKIEERIQPAVEQWLRAFYDAKLIFTDSFHACVFSIIFNKPFIVFGNKERGMSRFDSLLEMFELKERLILVPEDIIKVVNYPINWDKITAKLLTMQQQSLTFLHTHLNENSTN